MVQLAQYCFRALHDCFQHLGKRQCSKIFLHAGNNPVMHKNSTEHAQPLFIALLDTQKCFDTRKESLGARSEDYFLECQKFNRLWLRSLSIVFRAWFSAACSVELQTTAADQSYCWILINYI